MKISKIYLGLIFIIPVLLQACGDKGQSVAKKVIHVKKDVFTQSIFPSDSLSDFIGLPVTFEYFDDKLFVMDLFGEEGLIKVFDVNSGKILFSFAQQGNGPNEFLTINNLNFYTEKGESIVGLFDPQAKTYRKYYYKSLLRNQGKELPFETKKIEIDPIMNELLKGDSCYIATGFFEEGKFAILDESLNLLCFTGEYRPKPEGAISDHIHIRANHGTSFLSPDRKKLGSIVYIASVLDFYKVEKETIFHQFSYIDREIDYRIEDNTYANNQYEGYISACTDGKHIYALYSGEPIDLDDIATYGSEIHVFDMEGDLQTVLHCHRGLYKIRVDAQSGNLYAAVHSPEPTILTYNLSDK